MQNLSLIDIAKLSNGKLNNDEFADINIEGVSIDTRTIDSNEIYMPIIGEKFDGHQFIDQAFENGASAVFSEYEKFEDDSKPIIYVENSNQAFIDFAKNYKEKCDVEIIAITGSNGKTTTKDLISSVLESKYNTEKTIGNLNNEIGVPRTLLRFRDETDIGVVEMGTDGFGQIEVLSHMANPDVAIITNIGDSHLEQLKTKENIAKEKIHIVDGMSEDGVFIYNNDDEVLRKVVKATDIKQKIISFGTNPDSDYVIEFVESNNNGSVFNLNGVLYTIPLIGNHQIYNATVAIIIAELFDINKEDIPKALNKKDLTSMRSELMNLDGFDILNDSYKSNPQSLRSALETLKILDGYNQKVAILGDMLELGDDEIGLHREIGREISPDDIDYLLLYGPLSKYIAEEANKNFEENHVLYFDTKDALIDKAKYIIKKNTLVLVKASRSLRLEEIVEAIKDLKAR